MSVQGALAHATAQATAEAHAKAQAQGELVSVQGELATATVKLAKVQGKFEHQQNLNIDNMKVINSLEAEKRGRINTELTPAAPKQEPKQEPVIAPEGVKLAGDGLSIGKILEVKNGYIVQDVGRGSKVAHRIDELGLSNLPELGDMFEINRRGGRVMGVLNKTRGGIGGR